MNYKVGVCQFKPKLLDKDYNLNKMEEMLSDLKADLIVLPELATSGYVFKDKKEVEIMAENAMTGETATLFKKLSAKNNCSYIVGFVEKEGEKFYNSAMLVNPDGKIFIYRKIHLFFEEKRWFEAGNFGFQVFPAKSGVKIGLMICFDWIFPEAARTLALKGCEIIAHPANLVLPWCQQAMITRSLENRVFSVTANRTGLEENGEKKMFFTGQSQILSNKGEIIKRLSESEENVFIAEINPQLANNKNVTELNNIFVDRKPEFYY